jgi:hypothetical protein
MSYELTQKPSIFMRQGEVFVQILGNLPLKVTGLPINSELPKGIRDNLFFVFLSCDLQHTDVVLQLFEGDSIGETENGPLVGM